MDHSNYVTIIPILLTIFLTVLQTQSDERIPTYRFPFKFSKVYQNIDYTAKLSPLPSQDSSTVFVSKFNSVECLDFAPKIRTVNYDGRYLLVSFLKGPGKCNFQEYDIIVYNGTFRRKASKIVPTKDNVTELMAIFELKNISQGNHSITVGIHKKHITSCPCKNKQGSCGTCRHYKSKSLYLLPEKRCNVQVVPDESVKPDRNRLLIPYEIVIGLLLLTALALYITYWKLSVHLMVRKRGIVLFLDDHEHHTNAVTKVVDYLNEYHLKVYLASTFLKNTDIPDQMVVISEVLKSDFILLVLSPALQKRMEAWDKQQDYVEFFKQKNSNILNKAFLEFLLQSNKLFVCKFDHAAEFGLWPKPCYSLPSDLTRMAAELSGQSFSQRLILCNCLKSNALRRELQIAIKKTIIYEKSHSKWFLEKYVCPTNISVSHFDEISEAEYISPQKLNEIFTGYKDTSISLPEENTTAPSIYSVPISEKLEAINKRNS